MSHDAFSTCCVSGACLALPFVCGFVLGYCIARDSPTPVIRFDSALFVATALSITALPTLGRIMIEFNLTRTRLGVIAISSAAVNDVVAASSTLGRMVELSWAIAGEELGVFPLAE